MNDNITQENISTTQQEQSSPQTLEDYIAMHQTAWSNIVNDMTGKMRKFSDLPDLQNVVYSKRQDALDYYFNLLSKVSFLNRQYKKEYATRYNNYKVNSQIRYSSEAAINAQISSDLCDQMYQIELLENHAKYMQETIKTIDNIIFAISNRIRIEELISNVKK